MLDEFDTPSTPPDSGIEPEPTPEPAPEATIEPTTEQEPTPAPAPTPEEIIRQAEERAFQRTVSWTGRRDKELMDRIGAMIGEIKYAQQNPPLIEKGDPAALLENPDAYLGSVVPKILDREIARRTQAEQTYMSTVIKNAAQIMDTDPLFEDKEFAADTIKEAEKQFAAIDK